MIRWEDAAASIQKIYPGAYLRHLPGVGAPIVIPEVVEGLGLSGVTGYAFTKGECLTHVVLGESYKETEDDVLPLVRTVAAKFGLHRVTDERRQTWRLGSVQAMLQLYSPLVPGDATSEFHLRINRPGSLQSEFRIFDVGVGHRRFPTPPPSAWDHAVTVATIRLDGFVVCPFCRKAFSVADSARWDGVRHRSCGQRIQIGASPG